MIAGMPVSFSRPSNFPQSVVCGFSTRHGGVSTGPYAALNLSSGWGDDPACVRENFERLGRDVGAELSDLATIRQVHGRAMLRACQIDSSSEADGIWAHRADAGPELFGVRTADCVPLLLATRDGALVAAVHSGWRGTVADIAGAAVDALLAQGARVDGIMAAIGPCIETRAFEVGDEVADQFPAAHVDRSYEGRPHVDLVGCVREQLIRKGVMARHIERVGGCTHDHPKDYFSYRRDGRPTGQLLAFIGWQRETDRVE